MWPKSLKWGKVTLTIEFIKNKKPITTVDKESDLFVIQGEYNLLSIHNTTGGEVVLRGCKEVLIPRVYREELMKSLHSTHLADRSMLDLARGSFFWPKMSQDLRTLYKSCNQCLTHSDSKPVESHNTIPDNLELLAPNETCHIDFMSLSSKSILVIKCKATGFIYARFTKDNTMEAAADVVHKYINSFDRPRKAITDGGPAFQSYFQEFLSSHHIEHRFSSAYRPISNSPAERGVKSLRDVLEKLP